MIRPPVKTRFAPSPTGRLHIGSVRTALFNDLWARGQRGSFLLRIEDTDAARGHERYEAGLQSDLRWLGLDWDEGPEAGGSHGPYAQSQRADIYREYFARLETDGLAYPCFCTEQELKLERKAQLAAGRPPRYSGKCRALSRADVEERRTRGVPATLRFRVAEDRIVEFEDRVRGPQRFATADIGDFVIRRSDGTPAFFFCNALDDALMGVTLVLRGEDHLANTPRQILLLEALGLRAPAYAHIPLVVGADGVPLSKRSGARSAAELREEGYLPLAVNNYLARLGHTYDEQRLMSLGELAERFALERIHRSPARYDEAQLLHWQREAVRAESSDALLEWAGEAVGELIPYGKREMFIDTVRPNVVFPSDVLRWARVFFSDDFHLTGKAREVVENSPSGYLRRYLDEVKERPGDPSLFGRDSPLPVPEGRTRAQTFQLLRAALTNSLQGPEFARLYQLLGHERIVRRLEQAIKLQS